MNELKSNEIFLVETENPRTSTKNNLIVSENNQSL